LFGSRPSIIGNSLIVAMPTNPEFSERKCTNDLNIKIPKIGYKPYKAITDPL
jgi:hypothetical protein